MLAFVSVAALMTACSSSGAKHGPDAGRDAAVTTDAAVDGSASDADHAVKACSDPQPWTPPPAPAACADAPPTPPTAAAAVTLTLDAATVVRPWNRFYEKTVASDHAHTVLCTEYGRNTQNALRKAHAQAGFQYVRFHALFDDDDAVYSEDAAGNPLYDWSSIDAIYDAITAAGMRPLVEISFTPKALASDPTATLTLLLYNNASPNISPPTGAADDWGKWTALMTAFVRHLEARYTAAEVRAWSFEVWNEPSWMYTLGDDGYFELYKNTVTGLVAADPQVRVGGPAGSAGESAGTIQMLIAGSINTGTKLDFVTYHRYGDDNGLPIADVADAVAFHESLVNTINTTVVKGTTFTGEVMNDEFGPSYKPDISRDNEVAATYIVKTIHLLGSDTTAAPPSSYGYWALSDLYEEIYTGTATAYRPGNFGLLLKGDPKIPESFDVAKPAFNAFRLLHMMGAEQLSLTGGTTADGGGTRRGGPRQERRRQRAAGPRLQPRRGRRGRLDPIERRFPHAEQPPLHRAGDHSPVHRRPRPRQLVPGLAGDGLAGEPDPTPVGHAAGLRRTMLLPDHGAASERLGDVPVRAERLRRRPVPDHERRLDVRRRRDLRRRPARPARLRLLPVSPTFVTAMPSGASSAAICSMIPLC